MKRRGLLTAAAAAPLALFVLFALPALAQPAPAVGAPAELATELAGARLQGSGVLRVWLVKVYTARLWISGAAVGSDWAAVPFALELIYSRALEGELIAERSLTEMRRQGAIDTVTAERWLGLMKSLFPDVKAGDRITGVNLPGRGARFFVNGSFRGESRELDFVHVFFGIWLSPKTSEPALRKALLGGQPP